MPRKPSVKTNLKKAVKKVGLIELGRRLDITYQCIYGWIDRNRMPSKEFSGESLNAARIEHATEGEVTIENLLGFVPPLQAKELARLKKSK